MTDTIHVRAARAEDRDALVRFNAAMALETEHKILEPAILSAGVGAVLAESKRGFYLVAECAGVVVGCLMITFEWSDWRNGDWWWLQSVYIEPSHRRHGVFRALYAHVEGMARARADVVGVRLYVERDNLHAQRTYVALGMQDAGYCMFEKTLRGGA